MDTEYVSMRRRMSRLRVQCGKGTSLEAEDITSDDPGFKGLIKYWKKHGIPIPSELLSDMADEKVKRAKAKGQGRRRSRELEDLHMCASTGKFNLEKLPLHVVDEQDDEEKDSVPKLTKTVSTKKPLLRRQTDSQLDNKVRGGSLKKKGNMNGVGGSPTTNKRSVGRTVSNNK